MTSESEKKEGEAKKNKQIDGKFFILFASFFMSHMPLIIYCIFQCVSLALKLLVFAAFHERIEIIL